MGEIKSTLDLVMEKTKHLSQSSEEKQAQRRKDIENRLRGMLQKYQDKVISLEHLQRDYEGLKAEFNLPNHTFLAGQVIDRLLIAWIRMGITGPCSKRWTIAVTWIPAAWQISSMNTRQPFKQQPGTAGK